jgi:hypothetical protein
MLSIVSGALEARIEIWVYLRPSAVGFCEVF